MIAAIDLESYYDDEISVVTMGAWHYARAADIYMVTVACDDGFEFVGHPKDCPWERLQGCHAIFANVQFDLTLLEHLQEKGVIPKLEFSEVSDVLDMSRYFGRPGSLAGASQSLLGEEMSKVTRNNMKRKKWDEMSEDFKNEVREYALKDARLTLRLWLEHGHRWPWHERELSRQTREMCMRGLPVDVERAKGYVSHLKTLIWEAEQKIPWAKEEDAKILSPKRLAEECRSVGIVPPRSLAQDSEECAAWEDKYGTDYPWIGAMRDWRRCNILLKKVEVFVKRTKPDGWMPYGLKYFGASTTGRWSGDSGLNVQNLPRKPMYGVDLRSLIKAPPGFKIVTVDLSQIEPRCLMWLVGDFEFLEKIKESSDFYDGQARAWGMHDDPEPLRNFPEKRHRTKTLNLGLQYWMSPSKFSMVSGLPLDESERLHKLFWKNNQKLRTMGGHLERAMKMRSGRGDFSIELPTGRELTYKEVSLAGGGLTAVTCRMGKMMRTRFWVGLIVENSTQATAREVFAEKLLNIEAENIVLLTHTHDEAVTLVPETEAEHKLSRVIEIMSETPEWMPGLPLGAEGSITDRYGK